MRFLFALLAAAALGCTSHPAGSGIDPQASDAAADDGGAVICESDSRVTPYTANMTATSASGTLKVTLVAGDPAPPARGSNSWTIKLADASGQPIVGAAITVAPFMPDHGHGTSIAPVVTPQSDGTYTIAPLYLFMPGVWRVTIGLASDAGTPGDGAQLFFCIAG